MDEALLHFHARGISNGKARAEEGNRRHHGRTPSTPLATLHGSATTIEPRVGEAGEKMRKEGTGKGEEEGEEEDDDEELSCLSDSIMAELERKAEEGLCDVEDLAGAEHELRRCGARCRPRCRRPRVRLRSSAKCRPLVP